LVAGDSKAGTRAWGAAARLSQEDFEKKLLGLGKERRRARLGRLAESKEASASGGLLAVRQRALPGLIDVVQPELVGGGRGAPPVGVRRLREAAAPLPGAPLADLSRALAHAALKLTLDHVRSRPSTSHLAAVLGRAAYHEVCLAIVETVDRRAWEAMDDLGVSKWTQAYLDRALDQQRQRGAPLPQWDQQALADVGVWLLGCVLDAARLDGAPVFAKDVERESLGSGKWRTTIHVALSPEAEGLAGRLDEASIADAFDLAPMIEPPKPWSTLWDGGYLKIRATLLERAGPRELIEAAGCAGLEQVFAAVNRIQASTWEVNGRVLQTVQSVLKRSPHYGPSVGVPDARSPHRGRRWNVRQAVWAAEAFRYEGGGLRRNPRRFWIPHRIDWRGRIYPLPSRLHFQRPDLERALLLFAEPAPLGTIEGYHWFVRAGAAALGCGNLPLSEQIRRMESRDTAEFARNVSSHPTRSDWDAAKNPWAFLAWCFEWTRYCRQRRGSQPNLAFETALPVGLDASSSVFQHYALLMRDPADAARVNLTPRESPTDFYGEVAARLKAKLEERARSGDPTAKAWLASDYLGRDLAKVPTMTVSYGSTTRGRERAIREWVLKQREAPGLRLDGFFAEFREAPQDVGELGPPLASTVPPDPARLLAFSPGISLFEAAHCVDRLITEAVNEFLHSPRVGMGFLQKCASAMAKARLDLRWTTPTAFVVHQITRKPIRTPARSRRHGSTEWSGGIKITLTQPGRDPDPRKARQSVAPNFIHSVDAAHLAMVVNAVDCPIAVIHDAVRVRPRDAPAVQKAFLQGFVDIYASEDLLAGFRQDLLDYAAERGRRVRLPPLPPRGDFDVRQVLEAEWAFC